MAKFEVPVAEKLVVEELLTCILLPTAIAKFRFSVLVVIAFEVVAFVVEALSVAKLAEFPKITAKDATRLETALETRFSINELVEVELEIVALVIPEIGKVIEAFDKSKLPAMVVVPINSVLVEIKLFTNKLLEYKFVIVEFTKFELIEFNESVLVVEALVVEAFEVMKLELFPNKLMM